MDDNLCLEERVNASNRLQLHGLRLTGDKSGHLIRDLWNEVQWLQFQIQNISSANNGATTAG